MTRSRSNTGYPAGAIGRTDDALKLIHAALAFDPLNPDAYQALGGVLDYGHDTEGAQRAWRRSLEISPSFAGSHLYIGATLLAHGRPQEALPEILAEQSDTVERDAGLAAVYFVLGRKRESDACLAKLLQRTDPNKAFWAAHVYAVRHDNDRAFEWLEKAYTAKELSLSTGRTSYFAPLHDDPRWKPFIARMGIPQ